MPRIIEAVYKNGVFRPLEKVDLNEGERVRIEIRRDVKSLIEKYGKRKVNLSELRDEIYDRRSHIH